MKIAATLASLAAVTLMSACVPAGYYDSSGEYRSYGKSDSYNHNVPMAATPPSTTHVYYDEPAPTTTIIYDRPGVYDRNGYYLSTDSGPTVPDDFFPPRGMCRVYFQDRPLSEQPPIESCRTIRSHHIPGGAYIMYGG